jgi:hypothetical protein
VMCSSTIGVTAQSGSGLTFRHELDKNLSMKSLVRRSRKSPCPNVRPDPGFDPTKAELVSKCQT